MDILKRELAPLTDGWDEIESKAKEVLKIICLQENQSMSKVLLVWNIQSFQKVA